jgi:hypothetical protein
MPGGGAGKGVARRVQQQQGPAARSQGVAKGSRMLLVKVLAGAIRPASAGAAASRTHLQPRQSPPALHRVLPMQVEGHSQLALTAAGSPACGQLTLTLQTWENP